MIVDAHQHILDPAARRHAWLTSLPRLRRPFGLADYAEAAAGEDVTASVLVQVLAALARSLLEARLNGAERELVFRSTAIDTYRLKPSPR